MELIASLSSLLMTIISFVVALAVIVVVHEFGHYIIGRWSGIRAEVFSVGFGPRLASRRDRRGTLWQIAAVPLGGYVRFLGDSDVASAGPGEAVDPAQARQTLDGAPLWARIATVAAGPGFSFLLAIVIFAGFAMIRGMPVPIPTVGALAPTPPGVERSLQPGDRILGIDGHPVTSWGDIATIGADEAPDKGTTSTHDWLIERQGRTMTVAGPEPLPTRIGGIAPNSAAASARLQPDDVILAVDGQPVSRFEALRPLVEAADGQPLNLEIWREGQGTFEVTLTPRQQDLPRADGGFEKRWLIGITGASGYFDPALERVGPLASLWLGLTMTWGVIVSSVQGMAAMIGGQISSCNLSGPISIATSTGQAAAVGLSDFVWWIGVLSAAIGFLNILPIPVLDGGHLAFYLWEGATGRPPSPRVAAWLTSAGLAAIIALMIFGLSNDLFCR